MRTSGTARVLAALVATLRTIAVLIAIAVLFQVVRGEPLRLDLGLAAPSTIAIMTASASQTDVAGPMDRTELRLELQELLAHDTMLAIRFMRSTISGTPDFVDAANAVVVRSADEIEQTLAGTVPAADARAFADGWSSHNQQLFSYATALRDGDDAAREQARAQVAVSAEEQAAVIADITDGYIAVDAAATSLYMRDDLLLYQIEAYADADYSQAYALTHEAYEHAGGIAATVAAGATGNDPHAVDISAAEQMDADLISVLGEHVELTTDSLRAAVSGSDEFAAATAAVDANTAALTDLMATAVGTRRARKVADLWSANIDQQLRYALAITEQDDATRRSVREGLLETAERLGAKLAKVTDGEADEIAVTEAVRSQQVLQLDHLDAYARGDYAAAADTSSTAHHRIADLARMLGDAFVIAAQQRMPDGGADTGGGGTATTS